MRAGALRAPSIRMMDQDKPDQENRVMDENGISPGLRRRIRLSQARDTVYTLLRNERRTVDSLRSAAELAAERHSDAETVLTADEIVAHVEAKSAEALASVHAHARIAARVAQCETELGIAA
jgi:hypothetical protein